MHGDPPALRDKADDVVSGDRTAAFAKGDQEIIHTVHDDTGGVDHPVVLLCLTFRTLLDLLANAVEVVHQRSFFLALCKPACFLFVSEQDAEHLALEVAAIA